MGKQDTRVAFVNPIAAGRSSNVRVSGPTIRDYLNRPRPTWDEVKEMIKASRKKGSRLLEEFEEKQNKVSFISFTLFTSYLKKFRLELDRERDKLLKEKCKRAYTPFSSSSPSSSPDRKHHKKKKKKEKKMKKPNQQFQMEKEPHWKEDRIKYKKNSKSSVDKQV
ncbi:protein FAM133B-like isoform X2 [Hydractinia symbiolongicarpus]|uniref:protein FAM133B-like isoform X2 n=1 Tax=Hydractinia symbiolongicarpus TaxID=13093 RepID=UPI00254D13E7|nr:protein FAM133B-like isoform X2 [Hydractinia symbiolongicarpus]